MNKPRNSLEVLSAACCILDGSVMISCVVCYVSLPYASGNMHFLKWLVLLIPTFWIVTYK